MKLFSKLKYLLNNLGVVIALLAVLVGCSNNSGSAKVEDKTRSYKKQTVRRTANTQNYPPVSAGQHRVQQGETLYSIAFRYGWDWRALAARNNIGAPYTIYQGQTISFSNNVATTTTTTTTSSRPTTTVITNRNTPTTTTTPATSTKPVATNKTPTTTKAVFKPVDTKVQAVSGGWSWPANGAVISGFSQSGTINKGLNISGQEGDPILAASAGTVVYAGNNLHGYGELLIVKHNDNYVSAYAHNRKLLVKEGQKVARGQRIADMGSTGADRVKLHFEIRQNGNPVDPARFLPKR